MRSDLSVAVTAARAGTAGLLHRALVAVEANVVESDAEAAVIACRLPGPAPFARLDTAWWIREVEGSLRGTFDDLLDARSRLGPEGGPLVVVIPTIGIVGAAGLVGLTTVAEGVRSMAKSAARQWAAEGVPVNLLALPLDLLAPETVGLTGHVQVRAGRTPDVGDVGAALLPLLQASCALVGSTLNLDGGAVMAP